MGVKQRIVKWLQTAKDNLVGNSRELKSLIIEAVSEQVKEVIKGAITLVIRSVVTGATGAVTLRFFQFPSSFWRQEVPSTPVTSVNQDNKTTTVSVAEIAEETIVEEETITELTTGTPSSMPTQFFNEQFFLVFALLSILFLALFTIRARR